MSRDYRINIYLEIDQDYRTFLNETSSSFVAEVLIYLFVPELDHTNAKEVSDAIEWQGLEFTCHAKTSNHARTIVAMTQQRPFSGGYKEADYEKDVLAQIERLKSDFPYRFEVQITVTLLDIDPALIIDAGNLEEEKHVG